MSRCKVQVRVALVREFWILQIISIVLHNSFDKRKVVEENGAA
jgi:hypothetical protein